MTQGDDPVVITYPLSVASATTRVLEAGTGERAVLLLHGVGARADRWRHNILPLARAGFHVYAVDFPGHGFATKGGAPRYSVAGYAQFVCEVLDELGVARVALVGTSLGGHVAAQVAVDRPGQVAALVLVGPLGLVPLGAAGREALAKAVVDTERDGIRRKLRVLVDDVDLVTESWVEEEWRINNSAGAAEALRHLAAYFADRIDEDLVGARLRSERPEIPVLLAWGSADVLVPTVLAAEALTVLPEGTRSVLIAAAGHAPYLERPEEFNAPVLDFLTGPGS
jgi:pimeloyl-ACP methyl ester carboxylesterase